MGLSQLEARSEHKSPTAVCIVRVLTCGSLVDPKGLGLDSFNTAMSAGSGTAEGRTLLCYHSGVFKKGNYYAR